MMKMCCSSSMRFQLWHNSDICEKFNPSPHTNIFWHLCSRKILQKLWRKEKVLIISNFSLCHNVSTLFNHHLQRFFNISPAPADVSEIVCRCINCRIVGKESIKTWLILKFLSIFSPYIQCRRFSVMVVHNFVENN